MAHHEPNLRRIRYVGEATQRMWGIKGRERPMLESNDTVTVSASESILMCKRPSFVPVEGDNATSESDTSLLQACQDECHSLFGRLVEAKKINADLESTIEEMSALNAKQSLDLEASNRSNSVLEKENDLFRESLSAIIKLTPIKAGNKTTKTLLSDLMKYIKEKNS